MDWRLELTALLYHSTVSEMTDYARERYSSMYFEAGYRSTLLQIKIDNFTRGCPAMRQKFSEVEAEMLERGKRNGVAA